MCNTWSSDKSPTSNKFGAPAGGNSATSEVTCGDGPPALEAVSELVARGESPAPEVAMPEVTAGDRYPALEVVPEAEEDTVVVVGAMTFSSVHEPTASEPATLLGPVASTTSSGPRVVTATDVVATTAVELEVVL
jgi:hypothetical protein